MPTWHDYDIRVWGDGDVSINSYDLLGFGQLGGASGIQCNTCDESRKEEIRKACMDVANAMRALDTLIGGIDDAVIQRMKTEDRRKDVEAVADGLVWQVQELNAMNDGLEWQVQELKAENARLRELASEMLSAMRHTESGIDTNCVVCYSMWFAQKLGELGIEVDDG